MDLNYQKAKDLIIHIGFVFDEKASKILKQTKYTYKHYIVYIEPHFKIIDSNISYEIESNIKTEHFLYFHDTSTQSIMARFVLETEYEEMEKLLKTHFPYKFRKEKITKLLNL